MTSAERENTDLRGLRSARAKRPKQPAEASADALATQSARRSALVAGALTQESQRLGLLDGDKSLHVSFRAPPSLVEAAKRATGLSSTSELGMLALMMLAQPDPVGLFLKQTRGRLGKDHSLDY